MTIKEEIIKILDKQNKKGMDTYGQTLDECPDDAYDWQQMMIEELVDALQYQIKENKRLKRIIKEKDNFIMERLDNAVYKSLGGNRED